jgi:hypothetical protein
MGHEAEEELPPSEPPADGCDVGSQAGDGHQEDHGSAR